MKTTTEFNSWSYWPKSPPDPVVWTMVEFVQGDDEGPSEDCPQKVAVADMIEAQAQGRLMAGVWWLPIPW